MAPGSMKAPRRTDAPGTTRTPAAANPGLQRELVVVLERTELDGLHAAQPEEQQDRLLQPLVDDDLAAGVDLGDAGLAAVEEPDRLVDDPEGIGVARVQLVAPRPEVLDGRLQVSHDRSS
jgi:hypothetical protein